MCTINRYGRGFAATGVTQGILDTVNGFSKDNPTYKVTIEDDQVVSINGMNKE